jgi:hypothetical protein
LSLLAIFLLLLRFLQQCDGGGGIFLRDREDQFGSSAAGYGSDPWIHSGGIEHLGGISDAGGTSLE